MDELDCFRYQGVDLCLDGRMYYSKHILGEGRKVVGVLKMFERGATGAKMGEYNGIVLPSVFYDGDTWEINAGLRDKAGVFEMGCLMQNEMSYCDEQNENIRTGCGLK